MMLSKRTQNISIAIALILLAAVLRIYGIGWCLPHVYEEATPLNEAWDMWGWGPQRSLDLNPHLFYYPSLFLYIQFLGQGLLYLGLKIFGAVDSALDYRVLFIIDKTPFYIMGRSITALFGVATVWVTYLLGRRTMGHAMAIPAAFLLAVNIVHISKSQFVAVDVPMAFFAVLTLLFAVRLVEAPARRNYILSGLAFGFAASIKYPAAILIFPLLAAHILARRKTVKGKNPKSSARNGKPPWMFFVFALAAALAAFFVTSPFILLDAPAFLRHFSVEWQHMRAGHFGLEASSALLYYARSQTDRILGWPLALLTLFGLAYLAGIRRIAWAVVLAAFLVPFFLAASSWSMMADRYILPVLPASLLFAGGMFAEGLRLWKPARAPAKLRLCAAALVVLLMGAPIFTAYPGHLKRLKKDTRTEAKEWIEANIPAGAFIVSEIYGPELFGPQALSALEEDAAREVLRLKSGTPHYAVQPIPMFSLNPERSEVFYDMSLYEIADVFITSSMVRSRYVKEPARFLRQAAFYDDLESTFQKLREFSPREQPGPTLTIYRNPLHDIPFGGRRAVAGPRPLRHSRDKTSGSEEIFYYNLGINYEAFRFYSEALASYELAFQYPIFRPQVHSSLVLRKTQILLALGRPEAAAEFLEEAAADARTRKARDHFLYRRRRILSRIRSSK